jgi:hypothetical protein
LIVESDLQPACSSRTLQLAPAAENDSQKRRRISDASTASTLSTPSLNEGGSSQLRLKVNMATASDVLRQILKAIINQHMTINDISKYNSDLFSAVFQKIKFELNTPNLICKILEAAVKMKSVIKCGLKNKLLLLTIKNYGNAATLSVGFWNGEQYKSYLLGIVRRNKQGHIHKNDFDTLMHEYEIEISKITFFDMQEINNFNPDKTIMSKAKVLSYFNNFFYIMKSDSTLSEQLKVSIESDENDGVEENFTSINFSTHTKAIRSCCDTLKTLKRTIINSIKPQIAAIKKFIEEISNVENIIVNQIKFLDIDFDCVLQVAKIIAWLNENKNACINFPVRQLSSEHWKYIESFCNKILNALILLNAIQNEFAPSEIFFTLVTMESVLDANDTICQAIISAIKTAKDDLCSQSSYIASFLLDPRVSFEDGSPMSEYKTEALNILNSINAQLKEMENTASTSSNSSTTKYLQSMPFLFEDQRKKLSSLLGWSGAQNRVTRSFEQEITDFITVEKAENVAILNILEYWHETSTKFPKLGRVARIVHTSMCCAEDSEHLSAISSMIKFLLNNLSLEMLSALIAFRENFDDVIDEIVI